MRRGFQCLQTAAHAWAAPIKNKTLCTVHHRMRAGQRDMCSCLRHGSTQTKYIAVHLALQNLPYLQFSAYHKLPRACFKPQLPPPRAHVQVRSTFT